MPSLPDELDEEMDVDSSSDAKFDDTVSMKSTSTTTSSMDEDPFAPGIHQACMLPGLPPELYAQYSREMEEATNVPFPDEHEIEEDQELVRKLTRLWMQEEGCKQDEGCKSVGNEHRGMNQGVIISRS